MADGNGEMPVSQVDRQSRDSALDAGPHPQVIVSRTGDVTFANLPARALFGIGVEAIGRPVQEFELTQQPMELRAAIDEAMRERRRVTLGEQRFMPRKGDERILEVTVAPLLPDGGAAFGVSVVFEDVSRYASMRRELEGNRRDLELAYEELQSTIDELETTNEELQSANEELQTTNEELQSTNEELETMNEELQSTNEELETINDELRDRTAELNQVNDFLEAILTSLGHRRRRRRSPAAGAGVEPPRRGPLGAATGRGGRAPPALARHRAAGRAARRAAADGAEREQRPRARRCSKPSTGAGARSRA